MDMATLVQQYWDRMNDNDWAAAAQLFSSGFVLDWPQTREKICSKDGFVAINTNLPAKGRWRFTIRKFVATGSSAVTEVGVTDGEIDRDHLLRVGWRRLVADDRILAGTVSRSRMAQAVGGDR